MRNGSNKWQQMTPALGSALSWSRSVFRGAAILKIRLSSNQQAAAPGAGQPAGKYLKISAVAFVLANRKWKVHYYRDDGNFCTRFKYIINEDLLYLHFLMHFFLITCHSWKLEAK